MSVSVPRVLAVITLVTAVALVAAAAPASAQANVTFVDSNITTDTTLAPADGPYRIVSNVTITRNATLSIEPGTTIGLAEGVSLAVAGDLEANGTASDPIRITASRTLQTPGSWGQIRTTGTGSPTISLTHVDLAYGTDAIAIGTADSTVRLEETSLAHLDGNGIKIERAGGGTTLEISQSAIQDVAGHGVAAARTDLIPVDGARGWTITATRFDGLETGIQLHADRISGVTVRDNEFEDIETGLAFEADRIRQSHLRGNDITGPEVGIAVATADASSVTIQDNELAGARTGLDLHLEQNVHAMRVQENRITDGGTGLQITHDPLGDGFYSFDLSVRANEITAQDGHGFTLQTAEFSDARIAVRNNTLRGNDGTGATLDVGSFQEAVLADNHVSDNGQTGLTLRARDVRNTLVEGNVIRENGRSGVAITAERQMEGVSIRDNELLDNAREGLWIRNGEATDGNYSVADNVIAANAYGVALAGPQTGSLERNAIVFNTVAFGDRVIRPDAGSGVGVYVSDETTDLHLHTNDIYGNRIGLLTRIDGTVAATDNFWGAPSGPYHRSINPEGEGNAVETEQGWVELVEARSERTGEAYARPTGELSISPNPAEPSAAVTVSAARSHDPDGTIRTYQFTMAGETTVSHSAQRTAVFETPGIYPVSVWVEDDMGIESTAPATSALVINETVGTTTPPTTHSTTTPVTQTTTDGTTTTAPNSPDEPGPGVLGWIAGIFGAVLYGTALLFGTWGTYQTLTEQPLSVRGRRIHVLAVGGVVIWAFGWLVSSAPLGRAAVIGAVAWLGLTAVAFAAVRATR